MATITLSVPDELKKRMETVNVINWSSVARKAFSEQLEDVEELKRLKMVREFKTIVSKSKFTEKDAEKLSEKVKESMQENPNRKRAV